MSDPIKFDKKFDKLTFRGTITPTIHYKDDNGDLVTVSRCPLTVIKTKEGTPFKEIIPITFPRGNIEEEIDNFESWNDLWNKAMDKEKEKEKKELKRKKRAKEKKRKKVEKNKT